MKSKRWEAIRFLLVIILAVIIAAFPFWYPKEKGHVQAGLGWSKDAHRRWRRGKGEWTPRTLNPDGEISIRSGINSKWESYQVSSDDSPTVPLDGCA